MRAVWTGAFLLLVAGDLVQAQDCEMVRNTSFTVSNQGTPNQVSVIYGAEISCPGGKRLIADQAVSSELAGRIDLSGNVSYRDGERALTAQRAEYYKRQSYIHASGNVVLRDLKTGSTVLAQEINYYQVGPQRKEALLEALPSSVRPRAVLREAQPAQRDSTTVVADMIQVFGTDRFRGTGSAVIKRDSLNGFGGIVEYDQGSGAMELVHQARIEGNDYRLVGDTIRARIERDTLREVSAHRNGVLETRDVVVEAPGIRIALTRGQVERMLALRAPERTTGGPQARVRAKDFRLAADSIDVRAPGEQLEQVLAVGSSFGERIDTLAAPPGTSPELQQMLATDWMRGDTVHAYFIDNPKAAADSSADKRVLDRVVTSGAPASSLYRRPERESSPGTTATRYSIGYMLARRIEVFMAAGEVSDVKASGDVRGVYLNTAGGRGTASPGKTP